MFSKIFSRKSLGSLITIFIIGILWMIMVHPFFGLTSMIILFGIFVLGFCDGYENGFDDGIDSASEAVDTWAKEIEERERQT